MSLIDKVKPEILSALEGEPKIKYNSSYRSIITSLEECRYYRDLTIQQVDFLITFLPTELHPDGRTDFYYGDYLLKKEFQV